VLLVTVASPAASARAASLPVRDRLLEPGDDHRGQHEEGRGLSPVFPHGSCVAHSLKNLRELDNTRARVGEKRVVKIRTK
jgi:hypothetical protein